MSGIVKRSPLAVFFVLAFALSWIVVLPVVINPALPPEPFEILGAIFGPTLSALLVLVLGEGRSSLGPFLHRYVQWRARLHWWLIVLFGSVLTVTIFAALVVGPTMLTEFASHMPQIAATYFIALTAGAILGPLWEEPGWRGFALPRLQSQHGPLLGTLFLGVLWAFWHLPGYVGGWLSGSPFALFVSSVAFSIVMTWIYNHTRGSILLMILLHSSSNATLALGALVLPQAMSPAVASFVNNGWIPAVSYSIVALLVLLGTRGTLSYGGK